MYNSARDFLIQELSDPRDVMDLIVGALAVVLLFTKPILCWGKKITSKFRTVITGGIWSSPTWINDIFTHWCCCLLLASSFPAYCRSLVGILQIMVNLSPDPTRPGGSELPTFSYGGEGIPRVLKQYRLSPHRYIFPIRWSNQLNQSERRIYAPLTWITTDPGNGLESARRQAIAWTNYYFIIN